jgi:hypothetical protein
MFYGNRETSTLHEDYDEIDEDGLFAGGTDKKFKSERSIYDMPINNAVEDADERDTLVNTEEEDETPKSLLIKADPKLTVKLIRC